MKLSFEDFWNKLVENDLWFDQTKMRFCRKDLRGVANECFIFLLASEQRWALQDYQDFRRCYQSFLMKSKDIEHRPQLQQVETRPEKKGEPPLTGDARMKWIKEWEKVVRSGQMNSCAVKLTYKEIADEGDWLPKKPAPYPSTNEFEVKKRYFHQIYVMSNYEAHTGDKLKTWKPEGEWLTDNEFELEQDWEEKKKELI
jgi:hypothetical protein